MTALEDGPDAFRQQGHTAQVPQPHRYERHRLAADSPSASQRFVVALIILAAVLVRLLPLKRYVTPDEPVWVYRSLRFADALASQDWAAVPSTGHPGVTTMWLGAAGVAARRWVDPVGGAADAAWIRSTAWLSPENWQALRRLSAFLPYGRVAVALTTALGLWVTYRLVAHLFDWRIAGVTLGLLAFDPFLVGHSGLLHTDALLATYCGISVLCLLAAVRAERRSWAWSLTSGAAGGLALLTKSLAAFLPLFALVLVGTTWALRRWRLQKTIELALPWGVACSATFLALFPAMWGAPVQTLRDLFGAPRLQSTAALLPTFFAGRVALVHGPEFYAAALPLRLGPLVLVGLVLSVRAFWKRRSLRPELAWLWLFALGYTALLALSPKKYDRYLLPVLPPLALAASLGIIAAVDELAGSRATRAARYGRLPLVLVVVLLQLLLLAPFAAYPLTAFNPLLGGPWLAKRLLSVNWGEGMGAAARWLNDRPDADQLTVAALSVPSFAPLFSGRTVPLDQIALADYSVRPASAATERDDPVVYTAHLGLLDHAVVVANRAPSEQASFLASHATTDDVILSDAATPLLRVYEGPGSLTSLADLPTEAAVAARIAGLSPATGRIWLVSSPLAAPLTAAYARQTLAAIATPVATATVGGATISQYTIRRPLDVGGATHIAHFGEQVYLLDALLPGTPLDASVPIHLRWRVPGPTPEDLYASFQLRDAEGYLWLEVGHPLVNAVTFPTTEWAPGEWADDRLTVKRPARIPPGDYTAELTVTDANSQQLGVWDGVGQFTGVRFRLGHVDIAAPADPEGPAACELGLSLSAGPLSLCAEHVIPREVFSGDTLVVALAWSATAAPEIDYYVRWRLVNAGGSPSLEEIVDLSSYRTDRWRAGDSYEARYGLRVDPAVPPGVYALTLNVLASDGLPLWSEDQQLSEVEVLPRDRAYDLPTDISHPLDLSLGGFANLRGFDIDTAQNGLKPGDGLGLTLYWQASGPADLDYTVFVHLVGPDGRPHGQVDRSPGAGGAPTTSWVGGQVIVDELRLTVADDAPVGEYHVAVGMYDVATGGRLTVRDASGQAPSSDQALLPVTYTVVGDDR